MVDATTSRVRMHDLARRDRFHRVVSVEVV